VARTLRVKVGTLPVAPAAFPTDSAGATDGWGAVQTLVRTVNDALGLTDSASFVINGSGGLGVGALGTSPLGS
jgi:hypothetical protein